MFQKRSFLSVVAILAFVCLSGCGGSSKPVSVAVTAAAATVDGTDMTTLTAVVSNDKNSGGVTWTVSGGGAISGATTSSVTYTAPAATTSAQTATVTATSVADTSKTGSLTITVPAAPAITSTSANLAGSVGAAYSVTLAASGGISPYTWTLTSGTLPSCLTVSSAGVISGTITASCAGTYSNLVFKATDSGSPTKLTATQTLSMTLAAATAITFTGTVPATATYGVAYTGSAAATGGAGTLTYAATGLPAGLAISSTTGAISGTPTAVGTSKFTVTAADAYGDSATQSYTITVNAATPTLSFATISTKTYGDAAFTVSATSASTGAVTYSVTSGPATISGNTVTLTGAGTVVLGASQAATANYTAATATTSFTVAAEVPTLSFASISTKVYGDAAFTVSASSASSGAITYSVTSGPATISGNTVTLTGAGTVVLSASQAANGNYAAATATTSFTVNSALSITTTSPLPSGAKGTAYSQQLAATGGLGTYAWSLTGSTDATNLAALGLTFSSTGLLSGTSPVTGGPVAFTAQVTDGTRTASASFSVTINASLAITTSALSPTWGIVGSSYSAPLAATGGSGSYTWSVTTGASSVSALGLSLGSSTGVLSGTSLVAGSASFTVTVTDASNSSLKATQSYAITVYPALTLTPNPSPLSTFTSGSSYNGTITVSGGSGTYASFQVNDGSGLQTVPSYQSGNMTLSSGFTLSMQNTNELIIGGTPTITSALSLAVTVTDSLGNVIKNTYTISPAASALTVTLNDVPQGMVGMPYTYNAPSISGGTTPYTVTYTGAPDGLAKNTSTNNLVGTPTSLGTATVTVKVTDSSSTVQTVTKTFSLPVVAETVAAHDSYLKGQYACSLRKYWDGGVTGGDGTSTLYRGGMVFAFAADGSGNVTGGEIDSSSPYSGYKSASTLGSLGGTYAVGADSRGYLLLTVGSSGSGVLALAGGNLNSSSQFSEFAITEMDDAGTSPSGQHGSGHCYKQDTTALSGIWPTGGYVFSLTGEDSSGYPESIVGSAQYTAGTSSTTGTITGVMDMVENASTDFSLALTGTTPSGSGTDAFGRTTMTAGPSTSEENTTVVYMTNNTKGQMLLMGTQAHNGTSDADFVIGEARKQVATNIAASYPFAGSGIVYAEGTKDVSGSTPAYKAMMDQFTGSSSGATTITINSGITNNAGTFSLDANSASGGITGVTMTYTANASTGRVTITGQTGIYFYLYDTNSAAVLFADSGKSGTGVNNLTGWIEPQTASGTWAASNFASSYFMYKIDNGNYNNDSQTTALTLDGSGNISSFASDEGGQSWASWDEGMTGGNGTTATAAVVPDTTDGTYGFFDVNFTSGTTTTTESYCYAISVDAATKSGAKGKLVCLDASSSNPIVNVIQE
jgi:hypothetical protein